MGKFIAYFEPMCIDADNIDEVSQIYRYMNSKPDISKIIIDKGFDGRAK